MVHIGNGWDEILKDEFKSEYYLKLREFFEKRIRFTSYISEYV